MPRCLVAALLVFGFAASAFASVVVVDPLGNPGGALLQSAINAAVSGDILIVRAGDYTGVSPIVVSGKGITLQRDAASPVVLKGLKITGVPAASRLVVRGFDVDAPSGVAVVPALEVTNSAGVVWMEDCTVDGAPGYTALAIAFNAGPALVAIGAASLLLERCTLTGGAGAYESLTHAISNGGDGASFDTSTVAAHGCTIRGGATGAGPSPTGKAFGGAGVRLTIHSSTVLLAGGEARGGALTAPLPQSASGSGLFVSAGSARRRDCTILAGAAPAGLAAPNVVAPAGAVTSFGAAVTEFDVSTPVVSGQNAVITCSGPVGSSVVLFAGAAGGALLVPPFQGSYLFGANPVIGPLALGIIPGSGTLVVSVPTAVLPAATPDAVGIQLQAVVSAPGTTLESASAYVQIRPGL